MVQSSIFVWSRCVKLRFKTKVPIGRGLPSWYVSVMYACELIFRKVFSYTVELICNIAVSTASHCRMGFESVLLKNGLRSDLS